MTVVAHPLIVKTFAPVQTVPAFQTLAWPDEAATQAFARQLAHALMTLPGARDALIELRGDLGAGKTTLARHLLQALGVQGRIKSPTYAVVESYTLATSNVQPSLHIWHIWHIWHCDFYRFNDPHEWEEAGFRDIFASPGLKLVEWADKAHGYLPQPDVVVALDVHINDNRSVRLTACTPVGEALLVLLAACT